MITAMGAGDDGEAQPASSPHVQTVRCERISHTTRFSGQRTRVQHASAQDASLATFRCLAGPVLGAHGAGTAIFPRTR